MNKKIENLKDHIILIGLGRVGTLAANELRMRNIDFVVIEENFDDTIEKHLLYKDILYIIGDATEDAILHQSGIEKARGMIVTTGNSATTVFVVLSAKVLNPGIFIVARADDESSVKKLHRAGADRVVNPYSIGGQRLASLMINPNVIDFFESSFGSGEYNLSIENIELPDSSKWQSKTLKEIDLRKKTGATILAVIRDEKPNLNPDGNFILLPGDRLVAFGTKEQLHSLEEHTLK